MYKYILVKQSTVLYGILLLFFNETHSNSTYTLLCISRLTTKFMKKTKGTCIVLIPSKSK